MSSVAENWRSRLFSWGMCVLRACQAGAHDVSQPPTPNCSATAGDRSQRGGTHKVPSMAFGTERHLCHNASVLGLHDDPGLRPTKAGVAQLRYDLLCGIVRCLIVVVLLAVFILKGKRRAFKIEIVARNGSSALQPPQ